MNCGLLNPTPNIELELGHAGSPGLWFGLPVKFFSPASAV